LLTIPFETMPPFIDERGSIQNLLTEPCGGVSIIKTKAGSYRSDHCHREDGHWLYVLSGRMHYTECAVATGEPAKYPPYFEVEQGERIFTGPRIWHKTFFPVDTVLISMSLRPRDHTSHESDVVRA
jgi:oxalate decarboxylase/phosphoglucose isomerase-like protein (cupin superfamily)